MDKAGFSLMLSLEARKRGIELREVQDNILELWIEGRLLARYSQTGVEIDNILRDIEAAQFGRN